MRRHLLVLACWMGGGEIPSWEISYVREQMTSEERWTGHRIAVEKEVRSDYLQAAESHWNVFSIEVNMIRFAF